MRKEEGGNKLLQLQLQQINMHTISLSMWNLQAIVDFGSKHNLG